MYKQKKISVVILNYNDARTTEILVNNIKDFDIIDQIVVVDNLSTDNSFSVLKRQQNDKVKVIQTDKNGGYSYGNNYGIRYSIKNKNSDILFVANPDVIFDENYIMTMVDDILVENIGAVTGKMLDIRGKFVPNCLRIENYYDDLLNCTMLLKKIFKRKQIIIRENGITYTSSLPGSLFCITRGAYETIEGFDDNTFLYCEERILGKRFMNCGIKMAIDTRISFIHNHSVSISKSINKLSRTKILYKSLMYYYEKYAPLGRVKKAILKIAMNYGIIIRFIVYNVDDCINNK